MLMVGKHKLDYQNDVDPVAMVDRQCIAHVRFRFSNFVHYDDNKVK